MTLPDIDDDHPATLSAPPPVAGGLGANRGGARAAANSRGLLMTILGEYVMPDGGEVWTQTLLEALAGLGVRDKTARQTIARVHERGWLDRTRVGRQTRWHITPALRTLLELGAARIYTFGQQAQEWDGRWLLLLATVPERERSIRYRMNVRLSWAGFGSLGNGMWLTPWVAEESAAADALGELGVAATTFLAELGRLGEGADLASQAWDLPRLRHHYDRFLADAEGLDGRLTDDDDAVRELTTLVHRWRQFPFLDPDLPPELLPPDWPGPRASRRFADLRAELAPRATRWWSRTEQRYTPPSRP